MTQQIQTTHPLHTVFAELGKDMGNVAKCLERIEQKLPTNAQPTATNPELNSEQVVDLQRIFTELDKYRIYEEARTKAKQATFLSEEIRDYELSEAQKSEFYSRIAQKYWHIKPVSPDAYNKQAIINIPEEYRGKFAYVITVGYGGTQVELKQLGNELECGNTYAELHIYLIFPDIFTGIKAEVIEL